MPALLTLCCSLLDIHQVGRRARDYCEVASRTIPTFSDVELALMDMGKVVLTNFLWVRC